jgi:hypothetical protein
MSKKIKTEKIYQVPVTSEQQDGVDNSDRILNSVQEYDEKGNLIMEVTYHPDGSISDKNEYTYDENGNLMVSVIYGEEEDALESRKITRDEKGNPVIEEITYLDGSIDEVSYVYEGSLLKEKIQKTGEGDIEVKEIFDYEGDKLTTYEKFNEYDEKVYQIRNIFEDGLLRESEIRSSEDEEPYRQIIEYDESGNRKIELRYNKKDMLVERNVYEADGQGRVVRVIEENPSRKNHTEFSYDDAGRLTHQVEKDMNDKVVSEIHRSYNEDGRLSAARVEYMDRMLGAMRENRLVYEYEYYD